MRKLTLAAASAALLAACGQGDSPTGSAGADDAAATGGAGVELGTEDERIVYSLGLVLGENISSFSLSEAEREIVIAGMRDALTEAPYLVDLETYGPQIQGLEVRREQDANVEFADRVAAAPGAERLPSGLIYVPVPAGDGANPAVTDTVEVHYHGTLRDGTVFDSSRERGQTATFPLTGVIPCWTEGVQLMQVGETAQLFCPSDIAYGDRGSPPVIAGGASLLFEVELISIAE